MLDKRSLLFRYRNGFRLTGRVRKDRRITGTVKQCGTRYGKFTDKLSCLPCRDKYTVTAEIDRFDLAERGIERYTRAYGNRLVAVVAEGHKYLAGTGRFAVRYNHVLYRIRYKFNIKRRVKYDSRIKRGYKVVNTIGNLNFLHYRGTHRNRKVRYGHRRKH